jgi:hypothetical protein
VTFAAVPTPLSDDQVAVLGVLRRGARRVGHATSRSKVSGRVVHSLCALRFVIIAAGGIAKITALGLEAHLEATK